MILDVLTRSSSLLLLAGVVFSNGAASQNTYPVVELTYGSFRGNTTGNITSFLGMPYASPPVGELRFRSPQPPRPFEGIQNAFSYGAACFQQAEVLSPLLPPNISTTQSGSLKNISEDCLFINVIKPAYAVPGTNLPVVFVSSCGFTRGDSSLNPGGPVVERSLVLGEPMIHVSINYRLNAFGFLASKEVQEAGVGNLAIKDQRFALEWVHQHIHTFGGDPSKVTIWGESAGSICVGLQMLVNGGYNGGLFRGVVMESGSLSVSATLEDGQGYYDQIVNATGCAGEEDTLGCLRHTSYDALAAAINETPSIFNYTSLNLAWQPRIDYDLFPISGPQALQEGLYTKVPFISGTDDDEGTIFSFSSINTTTNEEFKNYLQSNYFPTSSPDVVEAIAQAYPEDPIYGSPFGTGTANNLTSQFKRIAAFQGDLVFQAPRRLLLQYASQTQNAWSFVFKRYKSTQYVGSYHGADTSDFYKEIDYIGMDALINFVTKLDPNADPTLPANISYLSGFEWPQWNSSPSRPILTFWDPVPSINITSDTYRSDEVGLMMNLSLPSS
ncbi:hypothetical protein IEO21_04046 [Rhodonia placenta]|uniref:Carboxylic ester hydrolase n=1 Tax=Rhodonia placenta TaxID=104341 RepID=A0A8H7U2Y6_9APHY|nr:hypothetical protein IEO21_04046 [Postia placenta]